MRRRLKVLTGWRRSCEFVGFALALMAYFPAPASALSITFDGVANGVASTGFSNGGALLAPGSLDPRYALIHVPSGCTGVTCQEAILDPFGPSTWVVLGPNGTYPLNGTWGSDDANSQWIGPRADQTNPETGGSIFPYVEVFASDTDFYAYRLVFNLTMLGLDPTTADIQLAWASDAGVDSAIRLCGVSSILDPVCAAGTAITGSANGGPMSLTTVSIVQGVDNAFFSNGLNALDFIIYNPTLSEGTLNPSGLRVDIISATTSDSPRQVPEPDTIWLLAAGLGTLIAGRRCRKWCTSNQECVRVNGV